MAGDHSYVKLPAAVEAVGGVLRIKYNLPLPATPFIEMINIGSGVRKILQQNLRQDAGYHTLSYSKDIFSRGTYVVRLITSEKTVSAKIVVQ